LDEKLNKSKKMKKFIYKGFGLNAQETISFEIAVNDNAKCYCNIYSSDQRIAREEDQYNNGTEEIYIASEIFFRDNPFCLERCREGKRQLFNTMFDNMESEDWDFVDNFSTETPIYNFSPTDYVDGKGDVEEIISFIKKVVKERKEYWQNRRSAIKAAKKEVIKITPEQMMINSNEQIITIYEVIKKG